MEQFKRKYKLLTRVTFCVAVVVLLCVGLEIFFRTTHCLGARVSWSEPHDLYGWRFTPNRRYWYHQENNHPVVGTINSLGWRDKDRSIAKSPGTYRIIVLGDSFVEALQVELNRTFLSLAEDQLSKKLHTPVELWNMGRSGASQAEELLMLTNEVATFKPDMVIACFLPGNDIMDISPATATDRCRPFFHLSDNGTLTLDTSFRDARTFRLKKAINGWKQHSALVSLLAQRYNLVRQMHHAHEPSNAAQVHPVHSLCTKTPDPALARNYDLNKALIVAMADFCKERDIAFMPAGLPFAYRPDQVATCTAVDPSFDAGFFSRDLEALSNRLGILYLDLHEPFRKHYAAHAVPLNWSHWNYKGHEVAADALSSRLSAILARPQEAKR